MDGFTLNSWGPPSADAPAPAVMPSFTGAVAASPTAIPPAPPGVNTKQYREEAAKKIADDDQLLRGKAMGAIEYLDLSHKAKDLYRNSPDVFGPWKGTDTYQAYVRSPEAAILPSVLGGDSAQQNMEKYDQVKGMAKQLSTLGLKAAFGSRITNVDVKQHNEMQGNAMAGSSDSAIQSVERMEQQHFNTLQHAVDRGLVDPSRVPRDMVERGVASGQLEPQRFLPTIASPADAARLPKGSMFVNPAGKVLRVP